MDEKIIVGVLPESGDLQTLMNNILETEVEPNNISVVMKDEDLARSYSSGPGPLSGATIEDLHTKLIHIGLSADLARDYQSYLKNGAAVIAIAADDELIFVIQDILLEFGTQDIEITD